MFPSCLNPRESMWAQLYLGTQIRTRQWFRLDMQACATSTRASSITRDHTLDFGLVPRDMNVSQNWLRWLVAATVQLGINIFLRYYLSLSYMVGFYPALDNIYCIYQINHYLIMSTTSSAPMYNQQLSSKLKTMNIFGSNKLKLMNLK